MDQLTNFGNYFSYAEIGNASWSPDGKYLAFFIATKPSECGEGEFLAVMEIETRIVTNYCIYVVPGGTGPQPIWSPDSRFIAVEPHEPDNDRVIVVDSEQGWVAQVAGDNSYPGGWLATP